MELKFSQIKYSTAAIFQTLCEEILLEKRTHSIKKSGKPRSRVVSWSRVYIIASCFYKTSLQEAVHQDFPGGPGVKTVHFPCRNTASIPGQRTKIPHHMPSGVAKTWEDKTTAHQGQTTPVNSPSGGSRKPPLNDDGMHHKAGIPSRKLQSALTSVAQNQRSHNELTTT